MAQTSVQWLNTLGSFLHSLTNETCNEVRVECGLRTVDKVNLFPVPCQSPYD